MGIVKVSAVFPRKVNLATVLKPSIPNIVDISSFALYGKRVETIISLVKTIIVASNENIPT